MRFSIVSSPLGDIIISGHDLVSGVDFADARNARRLDAAWQRDDGAFAEAARQLRAYFAGELTRFDLDLDIGGTPFQQRVWHALRRIPHGSTMTYSTLAAELGEPRAVRAVGAANGRNPISIIIPCHRLIGSDGSLTGYGGGLQRKQWLLAHERGQAATNPHTGMPSARAEGSHGRQDNVDTPHPARRARYRRPRSAP